MANIIRSLSLKGGGKIPTLGLGTFTDFGQRGKPSQVKDAVKTAIAAGYRHIDCAWVYGTEQAVGVAIEEKINDGTVTRDENSAVLDQTPSLKPGGIWARTAPISVPHYYDCGGEKLWDIHHNPNTVKRALESSLVNLKTAYVDMFLIHWPTALQDGDVVYNNIFPKNSDDNMLYAHHRHADVWKAMEYCKKTGLTKNIGLSNFNRRQISNILNNCTIRPTNIQMEITPYLSNKRLANFCKEQDIVVTAFAPFSNPDRTWIQPGDPIPWTESDLKELAAAKGRSVAQTILRYHLQRGFVAIPKSIQSSHIQENIKVFDFELSDQEMDKIATLDRGFRVYREEIVSQHPEYPFDEAF